MRIMTPTDVIAEACMVPYAARLPQVGAAEHILKALDAAGYTITQEAEPSVHPVRPAPSKNDKATAAEINKFITHVYDCGRKMGGIEAEVGVNGNVQFDHSRFVPGALRHMEKSGLEIVRKGEPATASVAPVLGKVALPPAGDLFDPPAIDPRAKAVRDLIQARRLMNGAAEVLGDDATNEIFNNLEDPEGDAGEGEAA